MPDGDFEQAKLSQPPSGGLDPNLEMRMFVYEALRKPGQENVFANTTVDPTDKVYGRPLMPLLCGDNPITNTLPSKFLTLTRTQVFLLHQWAIGKFVNEQSEDIPVGPGGLPALGSTVACSATCSVGRSARAARSAGSFAIPPSSASRTGSTGDPAFLPDAGAGRKSGTGEFFPPGSALPRPGRNGGRLPAGLEPGDLTKRSALPWQADYNECSNQEVDVTYEGWNVLYSDTGDPALKTKNTSTNSTLWWPTHRPMQVFRPLGDDVDPASPTHTYEQVDWARGIPPSGNPGQSRAGDLKMVTAWKNLGFVVANDDSDDNAPPYVEIKGVAGISQAAAARRSRRPRRPLREVIAVRRRRHRRRPGRMCDSARPASPRSRRRDRRHLGGGHPRRRDAPTAGRGAPRRARSP